MRTVLTAFTALASIASSFAAPAPAPAPAPAAAAAGAAGHAVEKRWATKIAPKVMILSMFDSESVWTDALQLTTNLTAAGLSPLYPQITCDAAGEVCHMITGEAEINAACSVTALLLDPDFDFTCTYFLIAGIAGVNPYMGTLGSVSLARFAVQVALAYEIDARQIPSNWSTGYYLYGTYAPDEKATYAYGTEVFELNTNLRDAVVGYTADVALNDTDDAAAYRAMYDYAPANAPPAVFYGDVATSDVYYGGSLLSEAFGNITQLWTNGTGQYATTAQEDNATFEAMIRADKAGLMDFSRVVLMRTCSDFDREPPTQDAVTSFQADQGGFSPAVANILIAGEPIVKGILADWDSTFSAGVAPQDGWLFNSDVLHTLTELKKREVQEIKRTLKARR